MCINGYEAGLLLLWMSNQVESLKYSSYEMKSRYIYFKYFYTYNRVYLMIVLVQANGIAKGASTKYVWKVKRREKFQHKIFFQLQFHCWRRANQTRLFDCWKFLFNAKRKKYLEKFFLLLFQLLSIWNLIAIEAI